MINPVTLSGSKEYAIIASVVDDIRSRTDINGRKEAVEPLADSIINQIMFDREYDYLDPELACQKKYDLLVAIANNLHAVEIDQCQKVALAMKDKLYKIADKEYEIATEEYNKNPIVLNKTRMKNAKANQALIKANLNVDGDVDAGDPRKVYVGVDRNPKIKADSDATRRVIERSGSELEELEEETQLKEAQFAAAARVHEAENNYKKVSTISDQELQKELAKMKTEYSLDDSFVHSGKVRAEIRQANDNAKLAKFKAKADEDVSRIQKEATIAITGDQMAIDKKLQEYNMQQIKFDKELFAAEHKLEMAKLKRVIKAGKLRTKELQAEANYLIEEAEQKARVHKAKIGAREEVKQYKAKIEDKTNKLKDEIARKESERATKRISEGVQQYYEILDLNEKLKSENAMKQEKRDSQAVQQGAKYRTAEYKKLGRASEAEREYKVKKAENDKEISDKETDTKIAQLINEDAVNMQQGITNGQNSGGNVKSARSITQIMSGVGFVSGGHQQFPEEKAKELAANLEKEIKERIHNGGNVKVEAVGKGEIHVQFEGKER